MKRKRARDVTEILRDILASFQGETLCQGIMFCRANIGFHHHFRYVNPLLWHGFIEMEEKGKRRYPIKHYTLTNRGQHLLRALGGRP